MSESVELHGGELEQLRAELGAVRDQLAIYNLIASHAPIVDTQSYGLMRNMFARDGVLDRGEFGAIEAKTLPSENPEMTRAAQEGLAHMAAMPFVRIDGDTAMAVSYVATIMPDPTATPFEVAAHGSGRGHRLFRLTANLWQLVREDGVWKLARRSLRLVDGSEAPRELLRQAF